MQGNNIRKLDSWLLNLFFLTINFGIIVTPLIFSLINQELFEFPKMLFVYAVAALATGLWLARMIINKRLILPNSKLDFPILIFFTTQLLSTVFSIQQYTSIFGYYSRFNGGLLSTLAYTLIFLSLAGTLTVLNLEQRKKAQKMVRLLLLNIVFVGLISVLYALPEKFGHSPSCFFATGQFDTDCWKESTNPKYRIFGTFGQPNWLAAWLVTVLPIGLIPVAHSIFKRKNSKFLLGSIFSSLLLVWAIWLTDSRSGLLALLGGMITFLSFIFLSKKTVSKPLKTALLLITILIVVLGSFFAKSWWQKAQDIKLSSPGGSDSGAIRKVVWQGAWKIFQHYPWFGTGPETFAYSYYQFRPIEHNLLSEWDFLYNKAHNEWLNLLANTGVFGFASFLWIQLVIVWLGIKICQLDLDTKKTKLPIKIVTSAIVASLLSLQISNFFGFSTVTVTLLQYLLMSILAWTWNLVSTADQTNLKLNSAQKSFTINWLQKIGLISMILMQVIVQRTIFNIWRADVEYTQGLNLLQSGFLESGSQKLIQAIKRRPQEALFYDNLADQYANFAQTFDAQKEKASAQELTQLALNTSDVALKLNSQHLNFYKTRVRILTKLTNLNPDFINQALDYTNQARKLAPSDPKLAYNQAKIEFYLNQNQAGLDHLKETLKLKPNYPEPRFDLAQKLKELGQLEEAKLQYQYILVNLNNQDAVSLEQIDILEASLSAQKTQ